METEIKTVPPAPAARGRALLKAVWASGNWGELLSFKVFFSVALFIFSFFIPKIIRTLKGGD